MLGSLAGAWLAKKARDKGIGGPGLWVAVSAFGMLRRLYRTHGKRSEVIALAEPIRPGDQLVLTYPGKPGRKTRKELKVDTKRRDREAAELKRLDAMAAVKRTKWERSRAGRKAVVRAERASLAEAVAAARHAAEVARKAQSRAARRGANSRPAESATATFEER